MKKKFCKKCKNLLSINDFGILKKEKDGHNHYCKLCCKKWCRKWKSNIMNEKKQRKADKKYQARKRALGLVDKTEEARLYNLKNPKASRAQRAVYMAIKKGDLIRGECELKDNTCSKAKTQAHHEDYDKPLDVNWLCPSHHKKVDMGLLKVKSKK